MFFTNYRKYGKCPDPKHSLYMSTNYRKYGKCPDPKHSLYMSTNHFIKDSGSYQKQVNIINIRIY